MTDAVGTAAPGQDQQQQTTGDAPWSADLATRFADEAQRAEVDAFLRETVQPYVTQREQSAKPALELYEDLQANPGATYLELTTDLFGDDAAKAITAYLEQEYGEGNEPAPAVTAQASAAQPEKPGEGTDPRITEMLNDWEEQRNEKLYASELSRLQTANPAVPIKDDLFRPFVVAEEGDMERAFLSYQSFITSARAELFKDAATEGAPTAPPALGSGNQSAGTPPPTEKHYESVGEAIEDWAAEMKAAGQNIAPPAPGV